MGLGGTAKKLQKVANMAEDLYARLNDLRGQLDILRETVEQTNTDVEQLRYEQKINRALLEELAEQQGIDVNETIESVSTNTSRQATPQGPEQSGQEQQRGQNHRNQQPSGRNQQRGPEQQRGPDQRRRPEQQRGRDQDERGAVSDPSPTDRAPRKDEGR